MYCCIVSGSTESSADVIEDPLCKYKLVIPVFKELLCQNEGKIQGEFNFHKLHLLTHSSGYF